MATTIAEVPGERGRLTTSTSTPTAVGALVRSRQFGPLKNERALTRISPSRRGDSNPGPLHYECLDMP